MRALGAELNDGPESDRLVDKTCDLIMLVFASSIRYLIHGAICLLAFFESFFLILTMRVCNGPFRAPSTPFASHFTCAASQLLCGSRV